MGSCRLPFNPVALKVQGLLTWPQPPTCAMDAHAAPLGTGPPQAKWVPFEALVCGQKVPGVEAQEGQGVPRVPVDVRWVAD